MDTRPTKRLQWLRTPHHWYFRFFINKMSKIDPKSSQFDSEELKLRDFKNGTMLKKLRKMVKEGSKKILNFKKEFIAPERRRKEENKEMKETVKRFERMLSGDNSEDVGRLNENELRTNGHECYIGLR